jgi:nucleotide-binding universal stress UspA family protein/predicted Zn-ribbon and HTH transcriptional regulator
MYQTIGVALDSSPGAGRVARTAVDLARALGSRVIGFHVDPGPTRAERARRLAALLPAGVGGRPADATAPRQAPSPDPLPMLVDAAASAGVPAASRRLEGRTHDALLWAVADSGCDLLVMGARGAGVEDGRSLGSVTERLARLARVDVLVVRPRQDGGTGGGIVACVDGSANSFAGLLSALEIGRACARPVEAVAAYDPYLHYTLFNGIVGVLSEKASKVFKFKDQEKLHEEIIDTGLAKIYQAHLEVARSVAAERGADLKITLLDGKASQRILKHARATTPHLLVLGRIGVHSEASMDIGSTVENLLRTAPCDVLLVSRTFVPPLDLRAQESVQWTPEALAKMERVPSFVRGVARTAVVRWAMERGHSIITPSVIQGCMAEMMPKSAMQAMGYVAEELVRQTDPLHEGRTYVCRECGFAARDYRPVACPVCKAEGATFEGLDRQALEAAGALSPGAVEVEEGFDGKKLSWTPDAMAVLRRVPNGYERRRSKARIEKTARVRGLQVIGEDFALDCVQQEVADGSYLSARGETLKVEVRQEEVPDDASPRAREGSPLAWTDAAWRRLGRVPEGFMRDMTRERIEQFAGGKGLSAVNLALCEEGIAEGRRMMAEMIGKYQQGGPSRDALRAEGGAAGESRPT